MNDKETILVYDDERKFGQDCVDKLEKLDIVTETFKVEILDDTKFIEELKILKKRQHDLREGKSWSDNSLSLDNASIFIIDFELINLDLGLVPSGEGVAYYTRCYSQCGMIVGLNFIRGNIFDLTLEGNPKSFADLNISSDQLDNSGLWGEDTGDFRPWYWPDLPKQLKTFEKKIADVKENLDSPICKFLGFPKEVVEIFSRNVGEFIGNYPHETTFREFVKDSPNVLKGKDNEATNYMDEEMMGRIAASRVSKWLERLVLPGQDILVDAPHLVMRYPSLLKLDRTKVENWNKTAKFEPFDKLGLDFETIEQFRFKKDYWLSRPVWFSSQLSDCQDIKEVQEPWTREEIDFVFCEDSSSFYEKKECKTFIAKMESPYDRRFVRHFPGDVEYSPIKRLNL
ncbi:hypothetical protein KAW18_18335 [candidate division WOR-3 bacterium]|nr:hypothetical protein [candidate division WOR-3 bacterium]